jgi:hypothetical protein
VVVVVVVGPAVVVVLVVGATVVVLLVLGATVVVVLVVQTPVIVIISLLSIIANAQIEYVQDGVEHVSLTVCTTPSQSIYSAVNVVL